MTAYLLTDDLKRILLLSVLIGALNGFLGFHAAVWLDVSIAGSMAVLTGIIFLIVFIWARAWPDQLSLPAEKPQDRGCQGSAAVSPVQP